MIEYYACCGEIIAILGINAYICSTVKMKTTKTNDLSMRVNKISFKGFRGIKDQEFELSPNQTTVLIGENGSGKSSVLECLTILLSQFFAILTNSKRGQKLSFIDTDITEGAKETEVTIEVDVVRRNIFWGIKRDRFKHKSALLNKKNIEHFAKNYIDAIRESPGVKGIHLPTTSDLLKNLPVAIFYPTNRQLNKVSFKFDTDTIYFIPQFIALENAFDHSLDFNQFFNWFRERQEDENEKRLNEDETYRDSKLSAVRVAIESFVPDFANLRIKRINGSVHMVVSKQNTELLVDQLSHGEKNLIAMVGDIALRLAFANPELDNPLAGKGVVLIDEIELHLHPKWQRQMIPRLEKTFPNCQFIIATHSPQVVSHARRGSVFLIENGEIYPIENSYGRDSNWILETIMDAPERPENIQKQLRRYFMLIDENKLTEAGNLRTQIENLIGTDEPELTKADILIHRKKLLANEKNHKK